MFILLLVLFYWILLSILSRFTRAVRECGQPHNYWYKPDTAGEFKQSCKGCDFVCKLKRATRIPICPVFLNFSITLYYIRTWSYNSGFWQMQIKLNCYNVIWFMVRSVWWSRDLAGKYLKDGTLLQHERNNIETINSNK